MDTRALSTVFHAAAVIRERSSQSTFRQPGIYVVTAIALLMGAVLLHGALNFTERNAVFVSVQPFFAPVLVTTTLVSLYLALQAAVSTARERDLGTLEVLFYGPVNTAAFILGKFLAQVWVYAGMMLIVLVWTNLLTWLLNFAFSLPLVLLLVTSILSAAAIIAFGLLVAALGGRTRSTLVYFIIVVVLLVGVQVADVIASDVIPTPENATQNDPLLVVRTALAAINNVLQWVSPYAQLQRAMNALVSDAPAEYLLCLGLLLTHVVLLLTASILIFRVRGARAR
jgi:ABC-type transport system involved in multi-copper enzyme maturation permease subunit